MNTSTIQRLAWAALACLMVMHPRATFALGFDLVVNPSTSSLEAGGSITYTLNLTNRTGFTLSDLWVTNSFSTDVNVEAVAFTFGNGFDYTGSVFTNSRSLLFDFKQFLPAGLTLGAAQAVFTITPQVPGSFTNTFFTNAVVGIAPGFQAGTNEVVTNLVATVTNSTLQADLSVSISGFGQGILAGDTLTYSVSVTNRGPNAINNVVLTNSLPPGTVLRAVAPTNYSSLLTNGLLALNLGTLSNKTSSVVRLTVQPNNPGTNTFSASAGAPGLQDPHPFNNLASVTVQIGEVLPGQILATNASPMSLDRQTGLMNQTVRLVNISTSAVPSIRLTVSNLTNWLYNAVGTNNGNPFAVYANTLEVGHSVDLVLEYFVANRVPISVDNSNYSALPVPAVSRVASQDTNGTFSVTRTLMLTNGTVLIEFPSVPGASYSILYSSDASFTNALVAQPDVTAPADRIMWIDDGPPKTTSPPTSATSRFYRVIRN